MTERQKADYWDKRIRKIFDSNVKQKRIKEIYRTAYDKVEADILKLFEKLEEGQELTETELYQFDRFIQLQKGIKAQCADAGKELNTEVYSRLNEAYKATFDTAKEVYDLPGTWGVQNKKMAEQCIKTVWSGMHFSERIWRNARNKLAPRIERHVIDCVIGGRSKDECIKEIKRDFGVGFNDADRLVRTEVMNVINRAQCETYASEGIKKVKWITGRDNRMCEHCGSLEGKIFELRADGTLINPETGISQPVIVHPRCRCTIIPVMEFTEKELTNGANKLAKATENWEKAVPIPHTHEEIEELIEYAKRRNIKIYNGFDFDGDIDLLKEQIDIIAEMQEEYGIKQKITIIFSEMPDGDYAKTKNGIIEFNKKVLRNREVTNANLNADNILSSTNTDGIAVHEMGHLIEDFYGIDKVNGLDIAKKVCYTIYGKGLSNIELLSYLKKNISKYTIDLDFKYRGKPFNAKYYKEALPEIIAKNATNPDKFTKEFLKILKEVIGK